MVEALPPNRPNDSLAVTILPGGAGSNDDLLDIQGGKRIYDPAAIDAVSVPNKKPGRGLEWKCLCQLKACPCRCGGGRDVDVDDMTSLKREDQKDIERPERGRVNGEEIDSSDVGEVVLDEGAPALGRRTGSANHVLGDRGLADIIAQFQELAVDAWRTPERVFPRHPVYQSTNLDRHLGAASPWIGLLFQRQKSRQPVRCQRTTVSGWTIERWRRQSGRNRLRRAHNTRSDGRSEGRLAFRGRTSS